MVSRRQFLISAASIASGLTALQSCSNGIGSDAGYAEATRRLWRRTEGNVGDGATLMRELVRYATLAPSSHNTQCWKFGIEANAISILPDLSRRCPAVDPDDHHVFVSLGCAVENLAHAALAHGLHAEPRFDATRDAIRVALAATPAQRSPMFDAMASRQCTRGDYDGKPLSARSLLCSNVRARRRVSACCC